MLQLSTRKVFQFKGWRFQVSTKLDYQSRLIVSWWIHNPTNTVRQTRPYYVFNQFIFSPPKLAKIAKKTHIGPKRPKNSVQYRKNTHNESVKIGKHRKWPKRPISPHKLCQILAHTKMTSTTLAKHSKIPKYLTKMLNTHKETSLVPTYFPRSYVVTLTFHMSPHLIKIPTLGADQITLQFLVLLMLPTLELIAT